MSDSQVDVAVLDFNLGVESSLPIADALAANGTPFIFATGYGDGIDLPEAVRGDRRGHEKPYSAEDLAKAMPALQKA